MKINLQQVVSKRAMTFLCCKKIPLEECNFIFFSVNLCFQNFSNSQVAYMLNSSNWKAIRLVWITGRITFATVTLCGILNFELVFCHLLSKISISRYVGLTLGTKFARKIYFQIYRHKFMALSSNHLKKRSIHIVLKDSISTFHSARHLSVIKTSVLVFCME
jgi:hypothetical protein